jgi:hypothetical protein
VVPNETDLANGTQAGKNQQVVLKAFPNVVESYNYGQNFPMPSDVQATRPTTTTQNPYGYNNGYGNTYGRDRRYATYRFTNRDRQVVRDWASRSQLASPRLQVGAALDQATLNQGRAAPLDLTRQLPQPASDLRFLIIGESLVLVDSRNGVVDFVQFDRNRR